MQSLATGGKRQTATRWDEFFERLFQKASFTAGCPTREFTDVVLKLPKVGKEKFVSGSEHCALFNAL
jgi:hypothetical protein